jgi:hypothetical protein
MAQCIFSNFALAGCVRALLRKRAERARPTYDISEFTLDAWDGHVFRLQVCFCIPSSCVDQILLRALLCQPLSHMPFVRLCSLVCLQGRPIRTLDLIEEMKRRQMVR